MGEISRKHMHSEKRRAWGGLKLPTLEDREVALSC